MVRSSEKRFLSFLLIAGILFALSSLCACRSISNKKTRFQTRFFSIDVPGTFHLNEETKEDSDESCFMSFTFDPQHSDTHCFYISVKKESSEDFRSSMTFHINLRDFAEGKLPTTSFGGFDFISFSEHNFTHNGDFTLYVCRHESSGTTISILEGYNTPEFSDILSSLTFTLPDLGLSDPPYAWEQEAVIPDTASASLGEYTISAKPMSFSERVLSSESSYPFTAVHTAVSEDHLYTSDLYHLYCYNMEEDTLKLIRTHEIPDDSAFGPLLVEADTTISRYYKEEDPLVNFLIEKNPSGIDLLQMYGYVAVSPADDLLIGYGYRDTNTRTLTYDPSTGTFYTTPFSFTGVPSGTFTISKINITENHIFVLSRKPENTGAHYLYVFDRDGKFEQELKAPSIEFFYDTRIFECGDLLFGICDNPMRFIMWDKDGQFLGELSSGSVLGITENEKETSSCSMHLLSKHEDANGKLESAEFLLIFSNFSEGYNETLASRITLEKTS